MRVIPVAGAPLAPEYGVSAGAGEATGGVVWIAIRRKLGIIPPNERFG
ncbi:MAG: hypothetical protein QGG20_07965 [Dehalococcoidia bacterium]|nr:hypothetical protein [Dehalococcoidia bacterium]|tara:strand:- start:76 stop:219 length:144 start_codon:yes stop_codon:yes gene_type:complete